jgi:hypothetical protein
VVDVGNILGQGLLALTSNIIPPADISFKSDLAKLFFGGAIVLGIGGGAGALATISMGVLVSMFIAFFAVFLTLILRKIILTLLIVVSPFAMLLWILPNTSKWFKEWWNNFFKLVMMFPIVLLLFEAGRLFAATTGTVSGNTIENGVTPLFQLVGLTLPLFGVPFAFNWAGKGLAMGTNAVGKAGGFFDKRYGKGSDRAKQRAEERRDNNAMRFNNKNANPNIPVIGKGLGAVYRGVAAKRSGLGGFTAGASVPIKGRNVARVFGGGMSAAQKVRMNSADAKAQSARAGSNAQDRMRKDDQRTTDEKIHDATDVAYDSLLEQRTKEALVAIKDDNGVSIKDIGLDGKGRQTLSAMVERGISTGNMAMVGAALTRLGQSQGGTDTAQALAQGQRGKIQNADGSIDYVGGGGWNVAVDSDGFAVGADGSRISSSEDAVFTGRAALGGDWGHTVDSQYLNVWNNAMKGNKSMDINKPVAAAATDFSASDAATQHNAQHGRLFAYESQASKLDVRDPSTGDFAFPELRERYAPRDANGNIDEAATSRVAGNARAAASDYADAARGIAQSPILQGQVTTETQARLVEASQIRITAPDGTATPMVDNQSASTIAGLQATVPPSGNDVVQPALAEAIAQATAPGDSVDVTHVNEIHQQINATGGASSPIYATLEQHYLENGTIDPSVLPARTAPAGTPPPVPQAVGNAMAKQFKGSLGTVAAAAEHYAANTEGYRDAVNQAYTRGVPLPLPPQPPAGTP